MTRLLKRRASAPDTAVVTIETIRGARRLAATGPIAEAMGLRAGQPLSDARAICPGLIAEDADPAGDAAALRDLAGWCIRYTPLAAADDGPDHGLWMDVAGCAHLFGGEAALLEDLSARLERQGVTGRFAVADASGAAWALARAGGRTRILPSGCEADALRDLPTAALRLDAATIAGLRRLGLRTIGQLALLPRGELTARFGASPVLRLDQALGRAVEAIPWLHEEAPWSERFKFVEPVSAAADLERALGLLTRSLCDRLKEGDQGCRRFAASFFRADGSVQSVAVSTGLPSRDADFLGKLFRAKLEAVDPGFGVDAVVLEGEALAPLAAAQTRLADLSSNDAQTRIAATADVIGNRIGAGRVWRVAARESHVPERAVIREPVLCKPSPWAGDRFSERPIRLLRRPERLTVTALLPDEPPATFRWRSATHHVRAATGPERIAAEWWRRRQPRHGADSDLIRDYYKVEDSEGARFWVFRAGLHGGGRTPVWYMHGLFG